MAVHAYNLSIGRQRQADWFPGLPAQPALHTWQVFGERPFLKARKRAVEEDTGRPPLVSTYTGKCTLTFVQHTHRQTDTETGRERD